MTVGVIGPGAVEFLHEAEKQGIPCFYVADEAKTALIDPEVVKAIVEKLGPKYVIGSAVAELPDWAEDLAWQLTEEHVMRRFEAFMEEHKGCQVVMCDGLDVSFDYGVAVGDPDREEIEDRLPDFFLASFDVFNEQVLPLIG